jgi:hypothetical protein
LQVALPDFTKDKSRDRALTKSQINYLKNMAMDLKSVTSSPKNSSSPQEFDQSLAVSSSFFF